MRLPGGVVTGTQWLAVATAATQLGNGQLELTSRGNLQVRGLEPGAQKLLEDRLTEAGLLPSLTHERVRNLLASPLTGRDGAGLLDVRRLIGEFDELLCGRRALGALSGRFLFALDDGRGDVRQADADITTVAVSATSVELLLAGTPTGLRVPVSAAVHLMLAAAEAFLAERERDGANAWRLGELADGAARIAARVAGSAETAAASPLATEPLGAVSLAKPLGAVSPRIPQPGPVALSDGSTALVIGIPLGRLNAAQASTLTSPELILTPWRSIVVPDLSTDQAAELAARCDRLGLITGGSHPLLGVTACTGRPGCASALADVRADALAVHLDTHTDPPGSANATAVHGATTAVHWAGCSRRCGRPAGTLVDLVATGSGYHLSHGDRTMEAGTAHTDLRAALAAVR